MKKNRLLLIVVVALLLVTAQCDEEPGTPVKLPVPYYGMTEANWCGIACIQMWGHYDGWVWTQAEIAGYLGIQPGQTSPPELLANGVGIFTISEGHLERKSILEDGAQGDLIAATIEGIDDGTPSIMPFWEDHAVVIKGHLSQEDVNGRPIAEKIWCHDPRENEKNKEVAANILKHLFMPVPYDYWVIVGFSWYVDDGIDGHDAFVLTGGTYYGGPLHYDPKGLVPDPHMN